MPRTKRVANDQGQLRDHAVADGIDELGPAANDPRALGVPTDVETVDILNEQERDARLVALEHEPGRLVGTIRVDAPRTDTVLPFGSKPQPLVGHDPDRNSPSLANPQNKDLP